MTRNISQIKQELESLPTSFFVTKWIFEAPPHIFVSKEECFILWRENIAKELRIDPSDILITGSAALGFSLSPHKNFKEFDDKSDIDVSIISHHYFEIAWHDLLHTNRIHLPPNMRAALDDHRSRLIYWGTIATDKILPLLSFGSDWNRIINESKCLPELENRDINFRIYKDKLAVRNYLSLSVDERKKCIDRGEN